MATKVHCDCCDQIIASSVVTMSVETNGVGRRLSNLSNRTQWDLCNSCASRVNDTLNTPPKLVNKSST